MSQHPDPTFDYPIEPYNHTHDAGLAVMWNESDQQWPGGFTRGVPFTAERIADWMDKQVTIIRLVVRAPGGAVVGYGSLWNEPSQPGRSCYVDLLNVHPGYQGRSLCRRMLTQMVDYATEHGYQRMSIGTWSANLKAVPLYKKVGFYWKPNTSVSMENYIPLLRQLPILRDFFAQTDWYAHHSRPLQQVEDEQRHPKTGAMEVYLCRWARPDGESIEAVIDRKAQTITGLETKDFAAYAQVGESKPAQGLRYPITWEITNKRSTPLPVRLAASGDAQVQVEHAENFTLAAGETRTMTASYRCAGDAPRLEISPWRPKPTPQITTQLVIDEEELTLGSGLHYQPAVEISLHPSPVSLIPGLAQTVLVQVKNQLDRPLQGELQIVSADGLTNSWQRQPFNAEAQGYASAPLQLASEQEGTAKLALVASFQDGDQLITTAPQALPVLVRNLGSLVATEHHPDPATTTIYAENDFFYFGCEQREGRLWLHNKAGQEYHINLAETLGPPYTPNEFEQRDYQISLDQAASRLSVSCTIASNNFPGLTLGREVIVTTSALVQVRYWLQNAGVVAHTGKILTTVNLPDNFATNAQAALPRRERLITAMSNAMPEAEGDFPKQPAGLAEQWGAYSMQGQVHGVVWSQAISEHEWRPWFFDLYSAEWNIPAGDRVALSPLYLYCGPGDWRVVRRLWQQLNGQTEQAQLDNRSMPTPADPQQATLTPNPALTLGDRVTVQLLADNLRKQPINGRILLTPPAGWSVDPAEFAVEELQQDKVLTAVVQLTGENPPVGPATGAMTFQTTGFDSVQPFTILRLGDARQQVQISQERTGDHELWQIDNGRMVWSIAPHYHAGLVAWRERGSTVNHLWSAFPNEGEFEWMKPWFGGLRPLLNGNGGGWPGKFHQEQFVASEIERIDPAGLPWRGVRVSTEIQQQKPLQGIRAEIDYLTLPGSNLIQARFRVINNAPIYRQAWNPSSAFMLYGQVDGSYAKTVLYGESPLVGPVQRKRTAYSQWLHVANWAALVNPETGRALSVVATNAPEGITLLDSGARGGHLLVNQSNILAPNATNELVLHMALVDSLAAARQYAGL